MNIQTNSSLALVYQGKISSLSFQNFVNKKTLKKDYYSFSQKKKQNGVVRHSVTFQIHSFAILIYKTLPNWVASI